MSSLKVVWRVLKPPSRRITWLALWCQTVTRKRHNFKSTLNTIKDHPTSDIDSVLKSVAHFTRAGSGRMHVRLVFRRSWVRSSSLATFFHGDWSWNHSYGHSLPMTDSSRAVVRYWRKYVHQVLVNRLGLCLPRTSVVRITDRLDMTLVVDWDVKQQNKQTNHFTRSQGLNNIQVTHLWNSCIFPRSCVSYTGNIQGVHVL